MEGRFVFVRATLVLFLLGAGASAIAEETYDGLELQKTRQSGQLYLRPGASFEFFEGYGLKPCTVTFKSNWLRDQNRMRNLGGRLTASDVDAIKDALGAMCDDVFRAALEQAPAYALTDAYQDGEPVLVIEPQIVNLDINAPDKITAGRSRTYTTSAGAMTLVLELSDAATGELLARYIDRRRDRDTGYLTWSNGATNRADANRILQRWSSLLREGLDRVTENPE